MIATAQSTSPTIQSVRYALGTWVPERASKAARELVTVSRRTAHLRARLIGSRVREYVAYGKHSKLTERQLSDLLATIRNTVPVAVQFARVAIEAARPIVPPRAYACTACNREQDIDGQCITCGATVAKVAA